MFIEYFNYIQKSILYILKYFKIIVLLDKFWKIIDLDRRPTVK